MRNTSPRRRAPSTFNGTLRGTSTGRTQVKTVPDGSYQSIPCEQCGAGQGNKCKSANGNQVPPHRARQVAVIRNLNAERGI